MADDITIDKDEIRTKKEEKWIECIFLVEVMAVNEETTTKALEEHVRKMSKETAIYDIKYQDIEKIENPAPNIPEAFSKIVELKLFVKNLEILTRVVLLYGPSSVEIVGPNEKQVKIDELQNISNLLAALVHQFASAGAGGIVISPPKNK